MKVSLLDLRAQYQAIRDEISSALERVLEAQYFIFGRKLPGLRKGWHRIRIGKIRMLLRVNFKERTLFIVRIDYRGYVNKLSKEYKNIAISARTYPFRPPLGLFALCHTFAASSHI